MQKALTMSAVVSLPLLIALTAAVAGGQTAPKPTQEVTIYGIVSCSIPPPPPDPAKAGAQIPDSVQLCLARHGKVVIIDEYTQKAVPIENPDTVKGYEGHRISTSGYMNGDSFHVISVRII